MSLHQAEDETCSGKYWDLPRDLLHIGDHMDRFESGEMSWSTKKHKFELTAQRRTTWISRLVHLDVRSGLFRSEVNTGQTQTFKH